MRKSLAFIFAVMISQGTLADCRFGNVYEDYACNKKLLDTSKKQLNATYDRLYKSSDTATKKALQESQQAWLQYRYKQCNGLMGTIGSQAQGAGSGLIVTECLANMTKLRYETLKTLLD